MRTFFGATSEKMQQVQNPSSFLDMMRKYVDEQDPDMMALMAMQQEQLGTGAEARGASMLKLQQAVLNKEIGERKYGS